MGFMKLKKKRKKKSTNLKTLRKVTKSRNLAIVILIQVALGAVVTAK